MRTRYPDPLMSVLAASVLGAAVPSYTLARPGADPAIVFVASYTVTQGHGNAAVNTTYSELTVMNADGSNRTVLLTRASIGNGGPTLSYPAWSPDLDGDPANGYQGCLAVVMAETSGGNLYVMDVAVSGGVPQVSNLRKIVDAGTDPNVGSSVFQPGWSPDLDPVTPGYQGKIAFIGSTDGGNTGSINTVPMVWDGATAQLAASSSVVLYDGHPTGGLPFDPTWSPDGARIAARDAFRIFVLGSATGSIASSLSLSFRPVDLQWSRTGSRAVLRNSATSGLYTLDLDTGGLAPVPVAPSSGSRHPSWSPDDSSLTFANLGSARGSQWNIVRMDLSTGILTVLVNGQQIGRDLLASQPDWRRF